MTVIDYIESVNAGDGKADVMLTFNTVDGYLFCAKTLRDALRDATKALFASGAVQHETSIEDFLATYDDRPSDHIDMGDYEPGDIVKEFHCLMLRARQEHL